MDVINQSATMVFIEQPLEKSVGLLRAGFRAQTIWICV